MKLKLVTAMVIMAPGMMASHGALPRYCCAPFEHIAPARNGRLNAIAQEADIGLEKDGMGDGQSGRHDDRTHRVGQYLAEHQMRST
jgi:hypothetical protein